MFDPDRMRMERLRQRLSQKRLAEKIGSDQAHVSRIENGALTNLEASTVENIARALGCSMDYLCGLIDQPRYSQAAAEVAHG